MIVNFLKLSLIAFALQLVALPTLAVEIPWNGTDKVVISVTEGHWNLLGTAGKSVKLEGSELESLLSVEKQEGAIVIRSKDQLSKSEFGNPSAKTTGKKRDFEISLPAGAIVQFHLLEGALTASRLTKEGILHLQKGKMTLKDMSGSWTLHSQKGEVSVVDSAGHLQVDSYGAQVNLKNYSGDLDFSNFAGDSSFDKVKGFCALNLGSGSTKILASSGTLQFELGKGSLNVQQFGGRIEGQAQEGSMNFQLSNEGDLHLKNQAGKITVTGGPNSGAALNVVNQEGELIGPSYLKVARDGGAKSLHGRLKGEPGKSSIFIRSQEGVIVVR